MVYIFAYTTMLSVHLYFILPCLFTFTLLDVHAIGRE